MLDVGGGRLVGLVDFHQDVDRTLSAEHLGEMLAGHVEVAFERRKLVAQDGLELSGVFERVDRVHPGGGGRRECRGPQQDQAGSHQ